MNPYRRHPLIKNMAVLVYIFLYAPIIVLILYSFNASRTNVTFEGFIPRVSERVEMQGSLVKSSPCGPFHWFCELSKIDDVIEAAGNTLTIAFTSTIIATIIGTMAALALQRYEFKLKPFSQTSLYIPRSRSRRSRSRISRRRVARPPRGPRGSRSRSRARCRRRCSRRRSRSPPPDTHAAFAKARAKAAGFHDVLFLDEQGQLTESSTQSFFLVCDGRVCCAPLDAVLAGVTRRHAVDLARYEGIPVNEAPMPLALLDRAQEAF